MQHSTDDVVALILPAGGRSGQAREWQAGLIPVAHLPSILHAVRALEEAGATHVLVNVEGGAQAEEIGASIPSTGARVHFGNFGSDTTEFLQLFEREPGSPDGHALVTFGVRPLLGGAMLRQLVKSARESGGAAFLYPACPAGGRETGAVSGPAGSEHGQAEPGHEGRGGTGRETGPIAACLHGSEIADAVADGTGAGDSGKSGPVSLLIDAIRESGREITILNCAPDQAMPVVSIADCQAVEACFQSKARINAARDGVIMHGPETVWFSHDTVIEPGAVLEPVIVFGPGVIVREGATIRAFSHLEGCVVERGAVVGPYARLRPGTTVSEGARVGNFVEVKASALGAGTKVNHLSYIGDSRVEDGANVGAGTITCNFDGVSKHRTIIGEKAFVGSHSTLVAPVRVGAGAMTAAGTVVTKDVPDEALAIGRTAQSNKRGMARQLMARLRTLANRRP